MPIDITNSLKCTKGWSFASKGMNGLFTSRIHTTAILTIMVIILIMLLYPCKQNTPMWILLKLGFYIFIVSISIIFIHDCVLYNKNIKDKESKNSDSMVENINTDNVVYDNDKVKVSPQTIDKEVSNENNTSIRGGDTEQLFAMYGV